MRRTKTGQFRSVRLLAPLRDDLDAWSSQAGDGRLVSPTRRGVAWTEVAWRQLAPAGVRARGRAAGVVGARPYDLRHSAASLWLHEGRTIVEVATWMGHSGQMALSTYLHVMSDLGDERLSAEQTIRRARAALVPSSYPFRARTPMRSLPRRRVWLCAGEADGGTRTPDPFITSVPEWLGASTRRALWRRT